MMLKKSYRVYRELFLSIFLIFLLVPVIKPANLNFSKTIERHIFCAINVCEYPSASAFSNTDLPFINEYQYMLMLIMPFYLFIAIRRIFRYFIVVFPIEYPPEPHSN